MGRQERFRKVDKPLRRAGLEVLTGSVPYTALPIRAAWVSGSGMVETGGRGFGVAYGDPKLIERANRGWHDLAVSFRLLDAHREFLLALPAETLSVRQFKQRMQAWEGSRIRVEWRRVRLLDTWDIMGAAAAGFLGVHAGHPGFIMLSLDGGVAIVGTTWETEVGCLAVPEPSRTTAVRNYLQWVTTSDAQVIDPRERAEAVAWLDHNQPPADQE